MTKLSTEDISILFQQDNETLAKWSCALNSWQWPKGLPNPEPPHCTTEDRRGQLMNWIYEHVSQKLISRTWNHDMTDEEFEEWWSLTFGHKGPRGAKDEDRLSELYRKKRERLEAKPVDHRQHGSNWADEIDPEHSRFVEATGQEEEGSNGQ